MEAFSLNQLVLAKLRGYPWWPGLVCSMQVRKVEFEDDSRTPTKIRVDFIGENTQYFPESAFLPPDKVQPYSNWKKLCSTKQKVRLTQSLLRALELAKAFDQGRFAPDQLVEVNKNPVLELARAKKPSRTPVVLPVKQRKIQRSPTPESESAEDEEKEEEVEEEQQPPTELSDKSDQSEDSVHDFTDPSEDLASLNIQLDRKIGESLVAGSSLPSSNPLVPST